MFQAICNNKFFTKTSMVRYRFKKRKRVKEYVEGECVREIGLERGRRVREKRSMYKKRVCERDSLRKREWSQTVNKCVQGESV